MSDSKATSTVAYCFLKKKLHAEFRRYTTAEWAEEVGVKTPFLTYCYSIDKLYKMLT